MEEALQLNLFSVPEAPQPQKKEVVKPKILIETGKKPAPKGFWSNPENQIRVCPD